MIFSEIENHKFESKIRVDESDSFYYTCSLETFQNSNHVNIQVINLFPRRKKWKRNDMQFLDHFPLIVDEGEYAIFFFLLGRKTINNRWEHCRFITP